MIGLTEHWNASIRLFHAQYGGQVYPEEFQVFRPSDYKRDTSTYRGFRVSAKKVLAEAGFFDEIDEELHTFAKELFLQRLQQFAIPLHTTTTNNNNILTRLSSNDTIIPSSSPRNPIE